MLVSGSIGDHGVAIMSSRENLSFETSIESDSAALQGLVAEMVAAVPDIHCLRDPTRGGLATSLNEIAQQSQVGICIDEAKLVVKPQVAAACELLGLARKGLALQLSNLGQSRCLLLDLRNQLLQLLWAAPGIHHHTFTVVPHLASDTDFGGQSPQGWAHAHTLNYPT